MTTPRDDIAGLMDDIKHRRLHHAYPYQLEDLVTASASQLAALSARVKELEARPPLLDARSIKGVDELVKTLEARALRAQQERDEAYERAAKVAESPDIWKQHEGDFEGNCIAAAIRRLASGPEKN